jgi:restriction system protein
MLSNKHSIEAAVIEGELISDVFPAIPQNLDEHLDQLSQYVMEDAQRPIIVIGPNESGKTLLLRQFVSRRLRPQTQVEWLDIDQTRNISESVDAVINELRSSRSPGRLLVIMDNTGVLEPDRLQELINRLFNWKKVRSVIVTRATDIKLRRAHVIRLALPEGRLYGISGQLITPRREIISAVVPHILVVNETLIQKLKHNPKDLFKITPRQFEEVIAELLAGMGMDVELTPATRDGGKDILAYMNTELGRFLTLVEAKQHHKTRPIGVSLVRSLYGTLVDHQATSGMLVTTSRFAKPAKQFQERHKYQLTLKEYEDVVTWLLQHRRK